MIEQNETSNVKTAETPENCVERVEVVSGLLLVIDQFMIGNPDFLRALPTDFEPDSDDFFESLCEEVENYGGIVFQLSPGTYSVYRNTYKKTIVVFPEFDADKVTEERVDEIIEGGEVLGAMTLDTRCIAIIDPALCYREHLIEQYRNLRKEEDDKGARDMIRENGASVRYGFSRKGEEIEGFYDENEDILVLQAVE